MRSGNDLQSCERKDEKESSQHSRKQTPAMLICGGDSEDQDKSLSKFLGTNNRKRKWAVDLGGLYQRLVEVDTRNRLSIVSVKRDITIPLTQTWIHSFLISQRAVERKRGAIRDFENLLLEATSRDGGDREWLMPRHAHGSDQPLTNQPEEGLASSVFELRMPCEQSSL